MKKYKNLCYFSSIYYSYAQNIFINVFVCENNMFVFLSSISLNVCTKVQIGFEKCLKILIYTYINNIKINKLFLLFLKIFSYIRTTIYFFSFRTYCKTEKICHWIYECLIDSRCVCFLLCVHLFSTEYPY